MQECPKKLWGFSPLAECHFIARYCERSCITKTFFDEHFIAMECACGADVCQGWAAVDADPDHIVRHLELYGPRDSSNDCVVAEPW